MEPSGIQNTGQGADKLAWLMNKTGRVVVIVDVTPGVLEVEQRQPVLHCFLPLSLENKWITGSSKVF